LSDYVLKEKKKNGSYPKKNKKNIELRPLLKKINELRKKKTFFSLNGEWRRERRFGKRKKNVFQLKHLSRTHLASVETLILRDEEKMEKTSFNSFHSLFALK
jgi:hypothetical protein